MAERQLFVGTLVYCSKEKPWCVIEKGAIVVIGSKIAKVYEQPNVLAIKEEFELEDGNIHMLNEKEFLMPGLVDTHVHAPQYPNCGKALDLPLLDWLEKYTFPTEARFKDLNFAEDAYEKAVKRFLQNGTTCACYFATIHLEASKKLVDIIEKVGQRAFVGKVNMNQNSPEYYVESTEASERDTELFVEGVLARGNPRIRPVITPRFAPATDMDLMQKLASIAKKHDLPIQTHLSENKQEVSWVKDLYPQCTSYTDVYKQAGLLGNRTVLAHCVYLSDAEIALLKETGAGVSHCPNSNISIASGLCDVRRLLKVGVKVGLGTDCSGGYSPSILNSIRFAASTSKLLKVESKNSYKLLNHRDLLYLATLGGCQVLGLDNIIGSFEEGKEFDALRIDPCANQSPFDLFDTDTTEDVIEKFLYLGDDRNIQQVFVAGKCVHQCNMH